MTRGSLGLVPRAVPRAALASAEIMAGVTLAHAWAGGAFPPVPWLVAMAVLVLALSVPVVGCRLHLGAAVLGVGLAQLGLHALLTALSPHSGHAHAGPAHLGPELIGPELIGPVLIGPGHVEQAAWGLTGPMLLAHLASTLLVAVVWRVRRRLAEVVLCLPSGSASLPTRVEPVPVEAVVPSGGETHWLVGAPRRGPPRSSRCASAP